MTEEQKEMLVNLVENEGMEQTFIMYSDFKEIEDEEFHTLRKAYEDAHQKLEAFIGVDSRS
ncbi:hypothetical protein [Chitinophaga nivalis]|uniref:Uncharacterized protein n=1 Tax=Chitinophaga nivalis TaxID=2991709 RepID=A0ABT3IIN7_9BACT|nr:hypothetical protein [Chitinophaga nivalis]MCW3466523.1 hypothetical protein [Chitinophaga nivalis]MCW3483786.1 hypothetical protein [Chitinophaga nivalis]